MKQKMAKRVLAWALTAALVLPGVSMETLAAGTNAGDTGITPSSAELTVTNPYNNVIQAYEGRPLTFHVNSNKDDASYVVDGLDALDGAKFADGKFTWTPPSGTAGRTYRVTFTATIGSGETLEEAGKTVNIVVNDRQNVYKTAVLTVSEDTFAATWNNNDKAANYGKYPYLVTRKGDVDLPNNPTIDDLGNANNGLMGEKNHTGSDSACDGKLTLLKFDLSGEYKDENDAAVDITSLDADSIVSAELAMTYITCRADNAVHDGQEESLQVAANFKADSWTEDTVNWNTWISNFKPDTDYTDSDIQKSGSYNTHNRIDGTRLNMNGIYRPGDGYFNSGYRIDGRQIMTDITNFVRTGLQKQDDNEGHKYLSLAVNNKSGTETYFVSREGAGEGQESDRLNYSGKFEAINRRAIQNAAPSIIVTYISEEANDFAIVASNGQIVPKSSENSADTAYMVLKEGYEAGESDSFAVKGIDAETEVNWSLEGNTAVGKIKFNSQTQCIDVPAGLKKGSYNMVIKAASGDNTASMNFALYVDDNDTLPEFTRLRNNVTAVVGRPVSFSIEADNPQHYGSVVNVSVDQDDMLSLVGATFENGMFTWTPAEDYGGRSVDVTFTAMDVNRIPVRETVTIDVKSEADLMRIAATIPVTDDTYTHAWQSEKNRNYGAVYFLRASLRSEDQTGYLGEAIDGGDSDSRDGKTVFLKFDLSQFKEADGAFKDYDNAELALSYLGVVNSLGGNDLNATTTDNTSFTVRVASVGNGYDWTEGAGTSDNGRADKDTDLTYNNWRTWRDENNISIAREDFVSESFVMNETSYIYPNSIFTNGQYQNADGRKIRVSIKEFLDEALEAYKKDVSKNTLTLLLNIASSTDQLFVSKEGAANWDSSRNGEPLMAPSIELLSDSDIAVVSGPTSRTIADTYDDGENYDDSPIMTDSFAIAGEPSNITASCNVNHGNDECPIQWDAATCCLKIKSGLGIGTYTVQLRTIADKRLLQTFTVTVLPNQVELIERLLNNIITEQGRYTSESWAGYELAKRALELTVNNTSPNKIISTEDVIKGAEMLSSARTSLVTLENALTAKIAECSASVYGEDAYTAATWSQYQTALQAVEALIGQNGFTEEQLNTAVSAMEEKAAALAADTNKPLGQLAEKAKEAAANVADSQYTQASRDALAEKLNEALEILSGETQVTEAQITAAITALDSVTLETEADRLGAMLNQAISENTIPADKGEDDYTASTWQTYQVALTAANALKDTAFTEERLNEVISALETAFDGLQNAADKTELNNILAKAKAITDASDLALLQDVIELADSVYNNGDATESETTSAYNALNASYNILLNARKSDLHALITTVGNLNQADYKTDLTAIKDMIPAAQNAYDSPAADVNSINAAHKTLNDVFVTLERADGGNGDGSGSGDGSGNGGGSGSGGSGNGGGSGSGGGSGNGGNDNIVAVGADTTIGTVVYTLQAGNTVVIKQGEDAATVKIPAAVKVNGIDCKVVGIGTGAFKNKTKVKKVVIGANVTSIGTQAFAGCKNLTQVTLAKNVKSIGKKAFLNCKKLKKVTFKRTTATTIGASSFKGTKATIQVTLPKKMKAKVKKTMKNNLKKKGKIGKKASIK